MTQPKKLIGVTIGDKLDWIYQCREHATAYLMWKKPHIIEVTGRIHLSLLPHIESIHLRLRSMVLQKTVPSVEVRLGISMEKANVGYFPYWGVSIISEFPWLVSGEKARLIEKSNGFYLRT